MPKQRDSKLIEAVCGLPWCMERGVFDKMTDLVIRHADGELLDEAEVDALLAARVDHLTISDGVEQQSEADKAERARPWTIHGGVARIPVGGVIARHSGMVNRISGPRGVGHDTIHRQLNEAMADQRVTSILLHIDSPGGSAQGCETLAQEIFESRTSKPVYAYASGLMCSAGLYIGAQANEVYADTDALVGSIGTVMVLRDVSRRYEDEGVKTHVVSSGPNKGAGTPGAPITPEQLKPYQAIVDSLSAAFVRDLARGRGVAASEIQKHAGGEYWVAVEAVSRGLVDGTRRTVGALINELNDRHPARTSGATPSASVEPAGPVSAGTAEAVASEGASMPESNGNGAVTAPPKGEPATARTNSAQSDLDLNALRAQANHEAAARITEIQDRAQPYMDRDGVKSIVDAAVRDSSKTPESFASELLAHLSKADEAKAHIPSVQPGSDAREKKNDAVALVLANRMTDIQSKLEGPRANQVAQAVGYDSPELASRAIRDAQGVGSVRLMDLAISSIATMKGISFEAARDQYAFNEGQLMQAAFHGSSDFPLLLSNLAKKSLLAQFNEVEPFWRSIARRTTATDFKESTTIRLSESGDLRLILPGGTPDATTLNERAEKIKVDKYGRKLSVTYEMIRNDDLGAFDQLTQIMGRGGARLPDQLITAMLGLNSGNGPTMSDGKGTFFAAGRGNLSASSDALSYNAARKARTSMRKLKGFGPDEAFIEVNPRTLLVPTDLSDTADDITMQEYAPGVPTESSRQRNMLRGRLTAVDSPRLSGNRWYLFADPRDIAAFEVKFLDGQEQPNVQLIESESNPFSRTFWCWIPGIGVGPVNPEAAYSNPGA